MVSGSRGGGDGDASEGGDEGVAGAGGLGEALGIGSVGADLVGDGWESGGEAFECAGGGGFPEGWGGFQVLHIAGPGDEARVREEAAGLEGYVVVGFCDDMPSAYAMADAVVSRSGASSLTEIAYLGLPSILVPFPFAADDHQTRNAEVFSAVGAAYLEAEGGLTAERLSELAGGLMRDLKTRERMAQAARSLAVRDAAERVCVAIEEQLKRR